MSYIITTSGNIVSKWGPRDPISIYDIAVHLGRTPRWAGATDRWVSVLHHSMFCERYSEHQGHSWCERANAMAHDFHEAYTGDIPTPFKTKAISKLQNKLDRDIREDLMIPWAHHSRIKKIDHEILLAEAYCFGTDTMLEALNPGGDVDADAIAIVRSEYERIGTDTIHGLDSSGVRLFLERWGQVISKCQKSHGIEDVPEST